MKTGIKSNLYIIPLLTICLYYLYSSYYFEIHDFGNYYFGGYFFNQGQFSTDIYFPYIFNQKITDLGYNGHFLSYAPNTPFLAQFFSPSAFLPIGLSKLIFNILSIFLLIFTVKRLSQIINIPKEFILLLPLIFFVPIKNNILFGQLYFVMLFLLSEGFIAYKKKSYWKVSFFWGLSILLKVFPILLLGFLLFKKEYKAGAFLCLGILILLAISIGLSDVSLWKFYVFNVLNRANNGEIAGAFVDNYQSVFMFLKRLFVYDELENKTVIYESPILFKTLTYVFKIGMLLLLYYFSRLKDNSFLIFSMWLLVGLLVSAYGSTYSLLLLVFLYFSISKMKIQKHLKWLIILFLFLISNLPFSRFSFGFPFNYLRLFLLIILSIFFIYKYKELIKFKIALVVLATFGFALALAAKPPQRFKNLLNTRTPILTHNYWLKKDSLTYHFWNNHGDNYKTVSLEFNTIDTTSVYIKENQVFYKGKQLTFDKSNKQKPIRTNDSIITFLSDQGQGIGFFRILKVNLNQTK